jgi:predicted metal-dependent peptidase
MSDDLSGWLRGFVADPGFLARYPYYAAVLAGLSPVADPSIETMAVSYDQGRFYLHVNVEYFLRAPQEVSGILLHEVHHVVLGHLVHPKFFGVDHPALMEIAQEVSANEHVAEPLPDPITVEDYRAIGMRPGQSTLERYELLVASKDVEPKIAIGRSGPGVRQEPHFVDGHLWRSALGRSAPPPGGLENARQLLERALATGADDAAKHGTRRPLLAGKEPGHLVEQLFGTHLAPESFLDWRSALRIFVARARAPVHSWARPSRRFPARIGQVPGRIWRPRPSLRPKLIVAIDTSLSMTERELAEIARQLVPIAEQARLTVVECDVEITSVRAFDGRLPRMTQAKGRGGTDLRPVFDGAFLAGHGAEGIVFFTDGEGPWPARPPVIPTLWILTKPQRFECPWGERARLILPAR